MAASTAQFAQPLWFGGLLTLGVAASVAKTRLPLGLGASSLSLAHAVNFCALFTFGPAEATCIGAIGAWAQCTLRAKATNPAHRTLFSIATLTITVAFSGLPLPFTTGSTPGELAGLVRSAAIVAPLYFFINSGLVAGAIALTTRDRVARVWQHSFMWSAPSYLAGAGLAALAVATWERGWFGWLALLALPFYLLFRSYDSIIARLRKEQDQTRHAMDVQLATIEALALAIEAKAGCTPEHIRSIQQYAGMLATAAGLSEAEVQTIRTAALLHDVGNMAIPEHILSKPDKLTPEEFERVKVHTRVGADILRDVPFDGPVNELVLSHHERWDGLGYPSGLRGDDIPIGARILAIADCYTTLLTDRPYREARNEDEALNVVREFAGTAYDPALVHLFVEQLKGVHTADAVAPASGAWNQGDDSVALRDIAGAHREEQTLYAIAQGLGASLGIEDAMALIQLKVSRLVPSSTWALFLGSEEEGYACRYAHGAGTEALLKWKAKTWSELSLRLPSQADGRGAHGEELRSLLPCPLTLDGELIGGIVIYHTVPGCFTDDHRRILGRVSEQAAAVICNSTRFEQTQYESQTDPLTGLDNRRSLERHVNAVLSLAADDHRSVTVVVLDLDRLKEINDTYGHEAGDRVLRAIGLTLRAAVRPADMCARFGGDEYVVVLSDCTPEQVADRVRALQRAVAMHPFEPRPGVRLSLSISAGAARFPEDGRTFDELLAVGDERMYCDKAGRRTRHTMSAAKQERA
jgi:diguanylate cyclase (GGDEF)-like protein/putative nucleotidyltransferase with HDIG domain